MPSWGRALMRSRWAAAAVLAAIGALAVVAAPAALAQVTATVTGFEATGLGSASPRLVAVRVIQILLGFLGLVAVIVVLYGGYLWMTAHGNEQQVTRAKSVLVNAAIGLVIILSAFTVVTFIIQRFQEALSPAPGTCVAPGDACTVGSCAGSCDAALTCVAFPGCVLPGGPAPFVVDVYAPPAPPFAAPRQAVVDIFFSQAIDATTPAYGPAPAGNVRVLDAGGAVLSATLDPTVDAGRRFIRVTPAAPCPAPYDSPGVHCFDPGDYSVTLDAAGVEGTSPPGVGLDCSILSKPCTATFRIGDFFDTENPRVTILTPFNAAPVAPAVLFEARGTDDNGVSRLEFYDNTSGAAAYPGGPLIGLATPAGPPYTPLQRSVSWDTSAFAPGSVRPIEARAFDFTGKQSSPPETRDIVLRPLHCFNGVQDEGETGRDCGGNAANPAGYCGGCPGDSCDGDVAAPACQAAATMCAPFSPCDATSCTCAAPPVIGDVQPRDGAPGNYVTVTGRGFGASPGTYGTDGKVEFIDGAGVRTLAPPPTGCSAFWSDTQIVVEVPAVAAGQYDLAVTTALGLADTTVDPPGEAVPKFTVNATVRPGLCVVTPASGKLGDAVTFAGERFGVTLSPGQALFGGAAGPFTSWSDTSVVATVPNVRPAVLGVQVENQAGEKSNPLNFEVKPSTPDPRIDLLDPADGPLGQTLTISGQHFGGTPGTVYFDDAVRGLTPADTSFPDQCAASFWTDEQIVVKVPGGLAGGSPRTIPVYVRRTPDGASSNRKDFQLNTDPLTPALYCLNPDNGPAGTPVDLSGDGFGAAVGRVPFYNSVDAVVPTWGNQSLPGVPVPVTAETGPVRVIRSSGEGSNALNFRVGSCQLAAQPITVKNAGFEQSLGAGNWGEVLSTGTRKQPGKEGGWRYEFGAGGSFGMKIFQDISTGQPREGREFALSFWAKSSTAGLITARDMNGALPFDFPDGGSISAYGVWRRYVGTLEYPIDGSAAGDVIRLAIGLPTGAAIDGVELGAKQNACGGERECCGDGTCRLAGSCPTPAAAPKSSYRWRFRTGHLPPQVVEQRDCPASGTAIPLVNPGFDDVAGTFIVGWVPPNNDAGTYRKSGPLSRVAGSWYYEFGSAGGWAGNGIAQFVDTGQPVAGRQFTLTFWARGSGQINTSTMQAIGHYDSVAVAPGGQLTDAWRQYTATVVMPADVAGSNFIAAIYLDPGDLLDDVALAAGSAAGGTQSPSPWAGSTDACTNAAVSARFTTALRTSPLPADPVQVQRCDDEACASPDPEIPGGTVSLFAVGDGTSGITWTPPAALTADAWYRVTLPSDPALGVVSADGLPLQAPYVWKFRTSSRPCAVRAVQCSPYAHTLTARGQTVALAAQKQAENCNLLACFGNDSDAVTWTSGEPGTVAVDTTSQSCGNLATAGNEDASPPAVVTAAAPEGAPGECRLTVRYQALTVTDYYPACQAACRNAEVGASFSTPVDKATLVPYPDAGATVKLKRCSEATCTAGSLTDVATGLTRYPEISPTATRIAMAGSVLDANTYYRVILRDAIRSADGKALAGGPTGPLNYADGGAVINSFSWTFKTNDRSCDIDRLTTTPPTAVVHTIGARQEFSTTPWSQSDACSPNGQRLNPAAYDYGWFSSATGVGILPAPLAVAPALTGVKTCSNHRTNICAQASDCLNPETCDPWVQPPEPRFEKASQVVTAVGSDPACQVKGPDDDIPPFQCQTTVTAGAPTRPFTVAGDPPPPWPVTAPGATFALQCGFKPAGRCDAREFLAVTAGARGDANCDGRLNVNDIDALTAYLTSGAPKWCSQRHDKPCALAGDCAAGEGSCEFVVPSGAVPGNCRGLDVNGDGSVTLAAEATELGNLLRASIGRCDNDRTRTCKVDGDCLGGGSCVVPSKVCTNNVSKSCTADSQCNVGAETGQCGDPVNGGADGACDTAAGTCRNDPALPCAADADCKLGVTAAGCCGARPYVERVEWATSSVESPKVCPNSAFAVTFSTTMDSASTAAAVKLQRLDGNGNCGDLTAAPASWWQRAWRFIVGLFTRGAGASHGATWCPVAASVTIQQIYDPVTRRPVKSQAVVSPRTPLDAAVEYRVFVRGEPAGGGTGGAASTAGVQLQTAIPAPPPPPTPTADGQGNYVRDLTPPGVAAKLCRIARVEVTVQPPLALDQQLKNPRTPERPYDRFSCAGDSCTCTAEGNGRACRLISTTPTTYVGEDQDAVPGNQHTYAAQAVDSAGQPLVAAYQWDEANLDPQHVLVLESGQATAALTLRTTDSRAGEAPKDGLAAVQVRASYPDVPDVATEVPVTVFLCSNPWSGDGSGALQDGPADDRNNFRTTYCRDSGQPTTADDLPDLQVLAVPTPPPNSGIRGEWILKYPSTCANDPQRACTLATAATDCGAGNQCRPRSPDAVGVRVVENPRHLTPAEWYRDQRFRQGNPQSFVADGYPAVRDGRTVYVGAGNVVGGGSCPAGGCLYTNVYILSYNQGAKPETVTIFNQLIENLTFNINRLSVGLCQTLATAPVPAGNLLVNPSFESADSAGHLVGWQVFNAGAATPATQTRATAATPASDGSAYYRPSGSPSDILRQVVGVQPPPGTTLTLSLDTRRPPVIGAILLADGANAAISPDRSATAPAAAAGWDRVTSTFTLPAGYVPPLWVAVLAGDTDAVQLEAGSQATAFQDSRPVETCLADADCSAGEFCSGGGKSAIVRDVRRVSDVLDISATLAGYRYGRQCPAVTPGAPGDADCNGVVNAEDLNLVELYVKRCAAGANARQACTVAADCPGSSCAAASALYDAARCAGADYDQVNDVDRADLAAIQSVVQGQCVGGHGRSPALDAGSYVQGTSTSRWPSWEATLGNAVGRKLPDDPLNHFAACPATAADVFSGDTCWNEQGKRYVCQATPAVCRLAAGDPAYPPAVPAPANDADPTARWSQAYTYTAYGACRGEPGQSCVLDNDCPVGQGPCERRGTEHAVCAFLESCAVPTPDVLNERSSRRRFCQVTSRAVNPTLPAAPPQGVCADTSGGLPVTPPAPAAKPLGLTFTTPAVSGLATFVFPPLAAGANTCAANCTKSFPEGTTVVLAATGPLNASVRWTGCASVDTIQGTCTVAVRGDSTAVGVGFALPPPEIVRFTADPSSIAPGDSTTLAWQLRNVSSAVLRDGAGEIVWPLCGPLPLPACADSGALSPTPPVTTTYQLFATGPGGTVTKTVRVTVAVPPPPTPAVSVVMGGNAVAQASVTSSPGGIACTGGSGVCSYAFAASADVTLNAAVASGTVITWGPPGAPCAGSHTTSCTVNAGSAGATVTVDFTAPTRTLSVAITGPAAGPGTRVGTIPPGGGIDCPSDCSESVAVGSATTLRASLPAGVVVTWSNCTVAAPPDCQVTMPSGAGPWTVTARFTAAPVTLTVEKDVLSDITAANVVVASPVGVTPASCSPEPRCDFGGVPSGSGVTLRVTPPVGVTVTWTGGCSSTTPAGGSSDSPSVDATCTVTGVTAATPHVTVKFTRQFRQLRLNTTGGSGSGRIEIPSVMTCPSGQQAPAAGCGPLPFAVGAPVYPQAVPDASSTFVRWTSGPCAVAGHETEANCGFSMPNADTLVTAEFAPTNYTLTLTSAGTGTGNNIVTITASNPPATTTCAFGAPPCDSTLTWLSGTTLTVTANPDPATSTFDAWSVPSGALPCAGGAAVNPCTFTLSADRNLVVNFKLQTHGLAVAKDTAVPAVGQGTIEIAVSGVGPVGCTLRSATGCPPLSVEHGRTVTLTATADADSDFNGWDAAGPCNAQGNPCTFTMDADKSVKVRLTLKSSVAVAKDAAADGGGTVTATSPAIGSVVCALAFGAGTPTCPLQPVPNGESIKLVAAPDANSNFTSWTTCTGIGGVLSTTAVANDTCTLTADADKTAVVKLTPKPRTLTVRKQGAGSGTVSVPAAGGVGAWTCPDAGHPSFPCTQTYPHGTAVSNITATASGLGMTFSGWSGACTAATGPCALTMAGDQDLTAAFTPPVVVLTQNAAGAAGGTYAANIVRHNNASPTVVFVSPAQGYAFFVEHAANSKCQYVKTTDGGATWGLPVSLNSPIFGGGYGCARVNAWYDRWTPGNSGNLIHIALLENVNNTTRYLQLDPVTDTLTPSAATIQTHTDGSVAAGGFDAFHAVTRGTNGLLYEAAAKGSGLNWAVSCAASCAAAAASWSSLPSSPFPATAGQVRLPQLIPLPADTSGSPKNRLVALYQYAAGGPVGALVYRVWDGSTWTTPEVTIESNTVNYSPTDPAYHPASFAAVVSPTTNPADASYGDVYVAYVYNNGTVGVGNELRTAKLDFNPATGAVVRAAGATVLASSNGLHDVAVAYGGSAGSGSHRLYVAYAARKVSADANSAEIYYTVGAAPDSVSNGWSAAVPAIVGAKSCSYRGLSMNFLSPDILYLVAEADYVNQSSSPCPGLTAIRPPTGGDKTGYLVGTAVSLSP